MERKRHIERRETLAYWPARDVDSGEYVGLVTDLSEQGIRIHSRHEFIQGQTINLRISVDKNMLPSGQVSLSVQNVWCHASAISELFQAGFKIIQISAQARADLRKLMDEFSYTAPGEADNLGKPGGTY